MKQLLSFLMLLVGITASAQEFTYTYEGQTLNYRVLDNWAKTCEVTENLDLEGAVVIPEKVLYEDSEYSVTTIGVEAFAYCIGLTSIDIPNSVTTIEEYALLGCGGLTSINIHDIEAWCNISFSNRDSNPMHYADTLKLNGEEITNLVIPSSITTIRNFAFYGCRSLTSIDIPNSITVIGVSAFNDCSGLTSVEIPNSVTSIGEGAFFNCI